MTTSDTPAAAGQPANSPEDLKLAQAYTAWLASKNIVFLSGEAQPIKAEAGELRFYVAHPSRSAPLCKNCQHVGVLGDSSMRFQMCNHPTAPRCVVNGTPERRAESSRNPGRPCGPTGELFKPRKNAA